MKSINTGDITQRIFVGCQHRKKLSLGLLETEKKLFN